MSIFADNSAPPVRPVGGNNWKIIVGGTFGAIGALMVAVYLLMPAHESAPHDEEKSASALSWATDSITNIPLPGYDPPPRTEPPAPTPAATETARPPKQLAPAAQRPPEAKPMEPRHASVVDTTVAEFYAKATEAGRGAGAGNRIVDYRPGTSDGIDKLTEDQRQGLAAQKAAWLASAGNNGQDVVARPFSPPLGGGSMLQAGTVIRAVSLNAVNSDLPSNLLAQVTADVYDVTGACVLIPSASRLFGPVNPQLSYGQDRLQAAFSRILFADGSSQNIGSMIAGDAAGASGIDAEVNRHPWQMAGSIVLATVTSVLGQAGQLFGRGNDDVNIVGVGAGAAGYSTSNIGNQIANRELNRPNTLELPPGSPITLMLEKDVALPPRDGCSR